MLNIMLTIQHRFNPLHVHCRLVERGLNKTSSLSICGYYEIFIYSWLAWITRVGVRICRLLQGKIIMKMLVVLLFAVILVFGVAGIAKAIPTDFIDIWYRTAKEPVMLFLFGFALVGLSGLIRKFTK